MYVLDLVTGRACHWQGYRGGRAHKLLGLGRLIHRSLLETVDWELWTPSRNRGLDSDMSARLRRYVGSGLNVRHLRCADADTVAIDVKTQGNMWDYAQMQRSGNTRPIELQAFLGRHFSCDERDALERLAADGTWKRSLR